MLEIIILINLSKKIAAKAREKGRTEWPFVVLLIFLWVGGEISGGIAGAIVSTVALGDDEPNLLLMLLGALAGVITGAVLAFQIVKALAPARTYDDYEDEDEEDYDRPKRDHDRY